MYINNLLRKRGLKICKKIFRIFVDFLLFVIVRVFIVIKYWHPQISCQQNRQNFFNMIIYHHYIFIISQLWLTSYLRSIVVLLDTGTPGTSREIYSEDADADAERGCEFESHPPYDYLYRQIFQTTSNIKCLTIKLFRIPNLSLIRKIILNF